jgi:hypothetical protein
MQDSAICLKTWVESYDIKMTPPRVCCTAGDRLKCSNNVIRSKDSEWSLAGLEPLPRRRT